MKFSGVITNDQSKVHAKGQDQKSKVKVTEVTTQLNRFRTVTPVWIHIWWWNDAYSLMLLRRGALLFLKFIRQFSRLRGSKIVEFDPDWAFPDCSSSLNSPMAKKWCTKLEVALNNNNNVVFIKRWFQDGTNITYGYLTLAHKRWNEYTRGIRAKGKSTYPKVHNMK